MGPLWKFTFSIHDWSNSTGGMIKLAGPPDVKIGATIFSKKAKNKPHKVSHWVKTIRKPYAAYSNLF